MIREDSVRQPYVAGQFYDADPARLGQMIDQMYQEAATAGTPANRVRAMILPHAGYVYSGPTAVKTAIRAKDGNYRHLVVIAPSHSFPLHGIALSRYQAYETPLGAFTVNTDNIASLLALGDPLITRFDDAHTYEHALEVELPILRKIAGGCDLLPVICGSVDNAEAAEIAARLLPFWNEDTLWVISSDFTHYGRSFRYLPFSGDIQSNLRRLDMGAVEQIERLELEGFSAYLEKTGATICGGNPIKLLLAVIRASGDTIRPELVEYTTSGELTGDFSHCVSYAGIVFNA